MSQARLEIYQLFNIWMRKTTGILRYELRKRKIGVTDDLFQQLSSEIRARGEGYLEGNITMLRRGRFVDMGVGRGHGLDQSTRGSFGLDEPRKSRKPKKWYSPAFYGRLYDLMGAIGYEMVEQSVVAIKDPIIKA